MAETKDHPPGCGGFTAPGAVNPGLGQGREELWMGSGLAVPQPLLGAVLWTERQWKDTADS